MLVNVMDNYIYNKNTKINTKNIINKLETAIFEDNYSISIYYGLMLCLNGHIDAFYNKILSIYLTKININNFFILEIIFNDIQWLNYMKKIYKKDIIELRNNQELRNKIPFIIGLIIFSEKTDFNTKLYEPYIKQIINIEPIVKITKFKELLTPEYISPETQKIIISLICCLNNQHQDNFYKSFGNNFHKPNYIDILWDTLLRISVKLNHIVFKKLIIILHNLYYNNGKDIHCLIFITQLYMNPDLLNSYKDKLILDTASLGRIIEETMRINIFIKEKVNS
jgi:hypothetical protein